MSTLFDNPLKIQLNPKDRIIILSADSGRILTAEVASLFGQIFDLGELGNNCIEYPVKTVEKCGTNEIITLPLQIADVLLAMETMLCTMTQASIDIINETFIYNGINNTFVLTDPAIKVINVYIDNATFPSQVPTGAVTQVTIDPTLILENNEITVQYIK